MRKATAVVILILFSISDVRHVVSLMQESLGKFLGSFAALKQVKIPDLLNQLCNNSQANTTLRDACYGCFYRTSILPQGYPMLIAMSACANTYLNNTSYGHCQSYLRLRECVREAMGMIPRFNSTDMQLAQLYVNTTACVLAKTRCSYMNPVTGALQGDDIVNKLHLPSVNAILVNTDYDFNIIQLPFRHSSVDVCSKYRNVQQATWPSVVC
ncbi:uncharacterized protein LOC116845650 isoform X2 [Odontomachus brunneus]|uniref:uncharacterized protein LOC116845650 isoform X2 n=1 Tax=Odontomachus brunneus TaxID=486640 RepID=UPI0013F19278|nr:uncharacterized protein LOC116845650 isoform X2 [Odontomachus brunneus]